MATIEQQIESLLFITNQPFNVKKLAKICECKISEVEDSLTVLATKYNTADSGVVLQRAGDEVQLVTAGASAKLVKDYIKEETTGELTRPALETLTIIAYRGPITRAELEQIRGVNCSIILRNLLMRGLIQSTDVKEKQHLEYQITVDFLQFLGLSKQSDLPEYEKLNSSQALETFLATQTQTKP